MSFDKQISESTLILFEVLALQSLILKLKMKHGIYSDDKQEVKRTLLKGMCKIASSISEYKVYGDAMTSITVQGQCPVPFMPGVGDKLIFAAIIEMVIDQIMSEDRSITNEDITAAGIMEKYYYPYYSCEDREYRLPGTNLHENFFKWIDSDKNRDK